MIFLCAISSLTWALPQDTMPALQEAHIPSIPFVNILSNTQDSTWWYVPEQRSSWTVVYACWNSPEPLPTLYLLERNLQYQIEQEKNLYYSKGVEIRSMVDTQKLCIEWQGTPENLSQIIPHTIERLQYVAIDKEMWKLLQQDYRVSIEENQRLLSSVHQRGEEFIWTGAPIVKWSWSHRYLLGSWQYFFQRASLKLVVVGGEVPDVVDLLSFSSSAGMRVPKKMKETQTPHPQASPSQCHWIQAQGFPQIAVTQRFFFPELSATELRLLAEVLGGGMHARLGGELREKQGLVYAISAYSYGESIVVSYTIEETDFIQAMLSVEKVVLDLEQKPITAEEWARARGGLLQQQYQVLEDFSSIARILSVYNRPEDWQRSIDALLSTPVPVVTTPHLQSQTIVTGDGQTIRHWYQDCETAWKYRSSNLWKKRRMD